MASAEIERLWALARIDEFQTRSDAGMLEKTEMEQMVGALGVSHQIVTDHTSMVVASDEAFAERGIERRNRQRVAVENAARARTGGQIANHRVDRCSTAFRRRWDPTTAAEPWIRSSWPWPSAWLAWD